MLQFFYHSELCADRTGCILIAELQLWERKDKLEEENKNVDWLVKGKKNNEKVWKSLIIFPYLLYTKGVFAKAGLLKGEEDSRIDIEGTWRWQESCKMTQIYPKNKGEGRRLYKNYLKGRRCSQGGNALSGHSERRELLSVLHLPDSQRLLPKTFF